MRSSLARALTGTALTAGLLAVGAGAAVADDTHTVEPGDTMSSIAAQYDRVESWRVLADLNGDVVSEAHWIFVGQELSLIESAPTGPDTHTVVSGDTLAKIASAYPAVVSWQALAEANADTVSDPSVIEVGQVLSLSGTASSSSSTSSEPEPEAAPEPAAEPEAAPEPADETPAPSGNVSVATWDRLAECESSGDWSINTGNGYYGGLQFALSSWEWVGGTGMPHEASKSEQIARAELLLERQGWGAWPACSSSLGLR